MLKFRAEFSPAVEYTTKDGMVAFLTSTKLYDSLSDLLIALSKRADLITDPRCVKLRTFNVKDED